MICKNWLFILGTIVLIAIVYVIKRYYDRKKEKKKDIEKEFTFYFYEKYIKIRYKRQFERLLYLRLHKIFETDKYFYLYMDENRSLIIDKNGFDIGTSKEFSKFIKTKCPLKYRNAKK